MFERIGRAGIMCAGLTASLMGCASAPSVPPMPSVPSAPSLPSPPGTPELPAAPGAEASADSGGVLDTLGSMGSKALEFVGLKKPEVPEVPSMPSVPDSALPDWRVNWRIFASESLNVDEQGRSLGLLVRIFKLKNPDAFMHAAYDSFGEASKEKAALNDDLLSARELQLLPGQKHEAQDKIARDAPYIGIVALFRQPMSDHWRFAFKTADAARTGLSLGAHACALSVQVGEALGPSGRGARLLDKPCPLTNDPLPALAPPSASASSH